MREIEPTGDAKRGIQAVATSFYGVGGNGSMLHHLHIEWDAAFIGVFTFETADFPESEVALASAGTAGDWVPECAFDRASSVGAGVTIASSAATPGTPASVTVAGGAAGGVSLAFSLWGGKTMRVKVVCTAQGVIRIRSHGKF